MNTDTSTTIAPGHQLRELTIDGHTYSAAAAQTRKGTREMITVYRDGEVWQTRETQRVGAYSFVILQGYNDGKVAPTYSGKPKPAGSRLNYAIVRGSVPIQRAAVAVPVTLPAEEVAVTTPANVQGTTVPVAQPLADGELADLIRTKLATEEASTASLAAAAAAKVMADRTWRQAIVTAAAAGLSHRAIAAAAGCTHPTVAKVLAEEVPA